MNLKCTTCGMYYVVWKPNSSYTFSNTVSCPNCGSKRDV